MDLPVNQDLKGSAEREAATPRLENTTEYVGSEPMNSAFKDRATKFICNVRGHKPCDTDIDKGDCIYDPGCYEASVDYGKGVVNKELGRHCAKCGASLDDR